MERYKGGAREEDDSPEALTQKTIRAIKIAHSLAEGAGREFCESLARGLRVELNEIGVHISANDLFRIIMNRLTRDDDGSDVIMIEERFTGFLLEALISSDLLMLPKDMSQEST